MNNGTITSLLHQLLHKYFFQWNEEATQELKERTNTFEARQCCFQRLEGQ